MEMNHNRRYVLMLILGLFGLLVCLGLTAQAAPKKRKYRLATDKEIDAAGYTKVQLPYHANGQGGEYIWLHKDWAYSKEYLENVPIKLVQELFSQTDQQIDSHFEQWPNSVLKHFVKSNGDKSNGNSRNRGKRLHNSKRSKN